MKLSAGKNIRLFQNDFLEKFSHVHPITPLLLWGPVVGYGLASVLLRNELSTSNTFVLAAWGFAIWTLAEYVLHRWIFHFRPRTSFQKKVAFLIHGIHHDDPGDERRLLMPPAAGIVIASFFYLVFAAVLGTVACRPFFSGFIAGYLCYDYVHFLVHYGRPKNKVLLALKKNHMLHHYSEEGRRFGVSNTFWDHVFGSR